MNFDYNAFIEELESDFADVFTKTEIKSLLDIDEELLKDTPLSTGKRLLINYIAFSGRKITTENLPFSGDLIEYRQELSSGINMWVADNLKGKSSIFKVIKFALTGSNDLKANISKWLQHILVVFSINDKKYTVYINKEKRAIGASLYNKEILTYPAIEDHLNEKLFYCTSEDSFQENLKNFFFNQFDYYSLRWTQKNTAKDSNDLLDVGASWKTYFKSIFLESKDSGDLMYGSQGAKVFQMLLGLYLTSAINKLTVEKDKLMHLKGRHQSDLERDENDIKEKKSVLQSQLEEIDAKLAVIAEKETEVIDVSGLIEEYNKLLRDLDDENNKILSISKLLQGNRLEKTKVENRRLAIDDELNKLYKELNKAEKQSTDINEYLDIGIFFSNLEIKKCPSCSHTVSNERKQTAVAHHTCPLCTDDVSHDPVEVDASNLKAKLSELLNLQTALKARIADLKEEQSKTRLTENAIYNETIKLEQQQRSIKDTNGMSLRLDAIQKQIAEKRRQLKPTEEEKRRLFDEKAILKFRIGQLDEAPKRSSVANEKIEENIELFAMAISGLNKKRFEEGQSILQKLSDLMTLEVQSLGLRISEISITDRFEIRYKQDGDFLTFSEIAEGEQLRAKLAFYLSLIQLDIEYNYGRHSRFLIIDSPGKEEGDENYLESLTRLIKELEDRFGDQLQILIGTAERALENTVQQQFVYPTNTYVF